MNRRPAFLSPAGILLAVVLLLAVGVWLSLGGWGLLSPGPLNAEARQKPLGGVLSHAALGDDCGACHPAPWSGRTMSDACLVCHAGVAAGIEARTGLHGGLADADGKLACGPCHPEHHGPHGALTVLDESRFRPTHDVTGFSLASHRETSHGVSFACADCHPDGYERFDRRVCSRCHGEIDAGFMTRHEATYGVDCLACHDGSGRIGAGFDHDATGFPLQGEHAGVPCRDCHEGAESAGDLERTPAGCSSCHARDDEHGGAYGRRCGDCHTAAGWDEVTFDHEVFPLDHGSEERTAACGTCHPRKPDSYTCYGCHEHTTANILEKHEGQPLGELADCVRCHPGGREAEED